MTQEDWAAIQARQQVRAVASLMKGAVGHSKAFDEVAGRQLAQAAETMAKETIHGKRHGK